MIVKLSKGIVDYLYGSRMTMDEIVTYLNENYGNGDTPFTKTNVPAMFRANGYNLRKRPRQVQFQIIVEDEKPLPEIAPTSPDSTEEDAQEDGPDDFPKEEEPTYFLNHNNN